MPAVTVSQGNVHAQQAEITPGLVMEWQDVESFLTEWDKRKHSKRTLERYRYFLMKLYNFLPEDHVIGKSTLCNWRNQLLQSGYAPSTVNLNISVCNTWLEYMGRRELQMPVRLETKSKSRSALTREEYFRLLIAARAQRQERLFLMIKVFGSTGLYANELGDVTVENIRKGYVYSRENGKRKDVKKVFLPEGLCKELLQFAERENIVIGPVFRSRKGTVLDRTTSTTQIGDLGKEIGIADGKASPSGLRLMYLANRAEVEADAARMVEQTLERQAAQEQLIVGWTV